ncbi:IclR family transcriptional regulator [Bacillus rubiinfantis]|uniref:IclR family transcriptional regulator n=1 Tax=Bacillus rubiinfantis TaxID=1499680 RepID=UPI0005A7C618|nr:IclR family transcriptional regulator [Bacillus rubiinfantis]
MTNKKTVHRLSTVDNAISLLTLFLKYNAVGLMDIERELGISKTAAFRLAATLTDRGFLVKNAKSKQYYPGPILFQLVQKFQVNDIAAVAQPFIQELAQLTNETIYLSIRTGNKYIFLTGIDSTHPVKVSSPFGDEIDLFVGAAGKLHMAFMSPVDLDTYYKRIDINPSQHSFFADQAKLRSELASIRESGYCTSLGEAYPDSGAIVAPIWGFAQEPIAGLGLLLPMSRLQMDQVDDLIALVKEYARKISIEYKKKQEATTL